MSKEQEVTLDELLNITNNRTKGFIKDLEEGEKFERVETEENVRREIISDRQNSELKKQLFVKEVKNGLGKEIKKNRGVRRVEKTRWQRIMGFVEGFFLKF
jgi:hypothetical protein|tara:strand:- start:675 stop:977 length:303 start_codon:yes stop_codon:yes gene_type:complete